MSELPAGLIAAVVALIALLFAVNVVADIVVRGYGGYPTTMLLAGLLGGALGVDRVLRGGNGNGNGDAGGTP